MRSRIRYLPTFEAEAGMTLAAPVSIASHQIMSFSLPAGHVLTADNLHQFVAHRAEFVFVIEPDERNDAAIAEDAAAAARRVLEIFSGADLEDPVMATLFDSILTYRSA